MVVEMRSRIRTKSLKLLGTPDFAVGPPDQQFAGLARAPMQLLALQADNQGLDPAGKPRSDLEDKVARGGAQGRP